MAGFVILDDGRSYATKNWEFRTTVEAIAEALPTSVQGMALAEWLRNDPIVQIYHSVDLRELTLSNREMLVTAIERAFARQKECGPPAGWPDPMSWDSWLNRFSDLVKMIACLRRGEPPEEFNPHMDGLIPPTGKQRGPGW